MNFQNLHEKITRPLCILIWCFVAVLNTVPIFIGSSEIVGPRFDPNGSDYDFNFKRWLIATTYKIVVHTGVTLPLALSIISNLLFGLYLAKYALPSTGFTSQEEKKRKSLQKFINGLVIWLIICNVPYIAWVEYSINTMIRTEKPWLGTGGVISNKISIVIDCTMDWDSGTGISNK